MFDMCVSMLLEIVVAPKEEEGKGDDGGDEGDADPDEIYNINMIDSSPKWKKITE